MPDTVDPQLRERIETEIERASEYAGRLYGLLGLSTLDGGRFGDVVNLLREYRGDNVWPAMELYPVQSSGFLVECEGAANA